MSEQPRELSARQYAIGDFAKKAGVSTHFLKFYEEKGILHPKVKENGYRYYGIGDASLVLECFRMKNMGLSVRQIEKGINDCTPPEVEAMLARQETSQKDQLYKQQMRLQGLHNLRAALRLCAQGEWSVRTVPDVWFLPHTQNGEFVPDDHIYEQLPEWLDWMPLVTSAQLVDGNSECAEQMQWGLGLEQTEAEQIDFAPQPSAQLVQQGRVLELYASKKKQQGVWTGEMLYQEAMKLARQLNLVPQGAMLLRVFCYTRKDGECWVHCAARVPVRLSE